MVKHRSVGLQVQLASEELDKTKDEGKKLRSMTKSALDIGKYK